MYVYPLCLTLIKVGLRLARSLVHQHRTCHSCLWASPRSRMSSCRAMESHVLAEIDSNSSNPEISISQFRHCWHSFNVVASWRPKTAHIHSRMPTIQLWHASSNSDTLNLVLRPSKMQITKLHWHFPSFSSPHLSQMSFALNFAN